MIPEEREGKKKKEEGSTILYIHGQKSSVATLRFEIVTGNFHAKPTASVIPSHDIPTRGGGVFFSRFLRDGIRDGDPSGLPPPVTSDLLTTTRVVSGHLRVLVVATSSGRNWVGSISQK